VDFGASELTATRTHGTGTCKKKIVHFKKVKHEAEIRANIWMLRVKAHLFYYKVQHQTLRELHRVILFLHFLPHHVWLIITYTPWMMDSSPLQFTEDTVNTRWSTLQFSFGIICFC
jgi:hypothetical protein